MVNLKYCPTEMSEVSQKEKHQYSILRHIYGIYKDNNNDSMRDTDIKNSLLDSGRRRGWDDVRE